MERRRSMLSFALALAMMASPATAGSPDRDDAIPETRAAVTWIAVEARDHANGTHGPAAVLFGAAQERGHLHLASLRVDCREGQTAVHLDADGLGAGPFAVEVRYSLDGGPFVRGSWGPGADRSSLVLTGDRAIAFLIGLYDRNILRLAILRPLSVPFLVTFTVDGAEPGLRPLAEGCHWLGGPAISEAGR